MPCQSKYISELQCLKNVCCHLKLWISLWQIDLDSYRAKRCLILWSCKSMSQTTGCMCDHRRESLSVAVRTTPDRWLGCSKWPCPRSWWDISLGDGCPKSRLWNTKYRLVYLMTSHPRVRGTTQRSFHALMSAFSHLTWPLIHPRAKKSE